VGPAFLLKVLTGSRAHGLADADSDYDYRGVFVVPTAALLSITQEKPRQTSWIEGESGPEGKEDATAWEVGHFLHLALQCNPTILEVFRAPVKELTEEGAALRALFPSVWSPKRVRDAFVGYGINQRKKFLDDKDARAAKYASAYLRTLYQASVLLETGDLPVDLTGSPVYKTLRAWRTGVFRKGEVIDACAEWTERVDAAFARCHHEPDPAAVDTWLLALRRRTWS
jgi:predicted nucleotidyltransferase